MNYSLKIKYSCENTYPRAKLPILFRISLNKNKVTLLGSLLYPTKIISFFAAV